MSQSSGPAAGRRILTVGVDEPRSDLLDPAPLPAV
jgi:hypothetical protein